MNRTFKTLRADMGWLLAISAVLTIFGLVFIYSSSSVYALERFGSASYFLKKQLFCLIPSIAGFFFFALVPLRLWRQCASIFFGLSLVAMACTFIPGLSMKVHGSSRWISLGGIGFQPSEVLKIFLFMYLGLFLAKRRQFLQPIGHTYLQIMAIMGVSFLMLLKQPDFGSVVTIFCTALVLFFVAEFNVNHLLITLAVTLPIGSLLVYFKAYRMQRILVFLDPWSDPLGKGFQIIQSLIAIGAGGVWGLGVAHSRQKFFYLPMQHTDFIFSIIAEETGFVGSCLLILFYVMFCYFGIKVVSHLTDDFAFFTSLSFIVLIGLQAVINLMVTCGLLPTKGLGLPFISYSGTAIVIFFCMLGFIVSAVRHQRELSIHPE